MPQVSIIVPVYNVEKYLDECIESILNQTFKDFELILVDDGSVDKSGEICDKYADNNGNIKVIHQENQGQASARNNGVKLAKSEWIMFVDSDDVIHYNLLKFLFDAAIESKSMMAVCDRIESRDLPKGFFNKYQYNYYSEYVTFEKLKRYYIENKYFYWAPIPALVKKEIISKIPFQKGRIFEDNAICCQIVYNAKKIVIIPYELYWYRDNPNGTMHQLFTEKDLDYLWALETQIDFYKKNNYKEMYEIIIDSLIECAFIFYFRSIKEKNTLLTYIMKKKLKNIKIKYDSYINDDIRLKRKFEKVLKPRIYRIKKILKIY